MKTLLILVLLTATTAWAKKDLNPADYPLSARVVSYEDTRDYKQNRTTNPNTGEITGYGVTPTGGIRVELKIDSTAYIATCDCFLKVGDTLQAQIVQRHRARYHWTEIRLLGKNKHGNPDVVRLTIVGQRDGTDAH